MRRATRRAPSRTSSVARGGRHRSVPPGRSLVACDPTSRGVAVPNPDPRPGARRATTRLLAVAVVAVSTSAPLIRAADAPTLAIAFWRNALSLPCSRCGWSPGATSGRAGGPGRPATAGCRGCRASFLAAHFATWIPSLSFTTVASSVALVATQPVWAALIARAARRAHPPPDLDRHRPGAGRHPRADRRRPVDLGPGAVRRPAGAGRRDAGGGLRHRGRRGAPARVDGVLRPGLLRDGFGRAARGLPRELAGRSAATTRTPGWRSPAW